jgi:branched-chain amino acid transport system ATP-binding protein
MSAGARPLLEVQGVSRHFGALAALERVTLAVRPGEVFSVIGPNGAGKSTLFNLIAGHLATSGGRISFKGELIDALPPHERARRGIAIVYQGARIFRHMSVLENVMVGAHLTARHGFWEAAWRSPRARREEGELRTHALTMLEHVELARLADRPAESLPLGQQRALQVARALAAHPALLLLDEPASGLRERERSQLAELIQRLRTRGLTILLVEHDVRLVTTLSDRITVLDLGRVIAEGTPATIRADPAVIAAYLGTSATA